MLSGYPASSSAEEYEEAWGLAKGFAKDYEILAAWASSEGRLLFKTVIKHHTFLHLAKDALHCNPKHHWTFRSEDFVGQIAKLAHSITMGTSATRISAKLSSKYRILLHLVLTRENFGLLEDNEDDDLSSKTLWNRKGLQIRCKASLRKDMFHQLPLQKG